jgi:hypothetical protein
MSLLIRFWYNAATEAKQIEPRPDVTNRKLNSSIFPEKTINNTLIKKLNKITFGIVEKNAVILIIEPS